MNVTEKTNGFDQLCCWPGTTLGDTTGQDFVDWIKEEFGVRAKFAEVVNTLPDEDDTEGKTGGRSDLLFWVHSEDIPKFAAKRLGFGIRWWEDVILNSKGAIYSDEVARKYPYGWDDDPELVTTCTLKVVRNWEERGGR